MTQKKIVLPEGWRKCTGRYKTQEKALQMIEIWNKLNNEYYYKIFPHIKHFIIARRLKELDQI